MFRAGAASVPITPDIGSPLAGFSSRRMGAAGVHDELFAKAFVIDDGTTLVVVVSADVLAFDAGFASAVRRKIASSLGCSSQSVLLTATHTHSGPVTLKTFFNPEQHPDPAYLQRLEGGILRAVAGAARARGPAELAFGAAAVQEAGSNRRSADGLPVDDEVTTLAIRSLTGNACHSLIHYACHPTTLGPENLLFSGDFPAFATSILESERPNSTVSMYANGAMGDVSVGGDSDLTAIGVVRTPRTFERSRAIGERIAASARRALENPFGVASSGLAAASASLDLPLKRLPSVEEAGAASTRAAGALADAEAQGAPEGELRRLRMDSLCASIGHYWARLATPNRRECLRVELQAIRIGKLVLLAAPVEVFAAIGLAVKQVKRARSLVVGPANGYLGYLPTAEAHAAMGYEVVASPFAPEAAERFLDAADQLQESLVSGVR